MKNKFTLLFIFIVTINLSALSQVDIKKSEDIRSFDGKEYYIHIVEKGHTLYSLSRVYEIPIDEIIFENPAAKTQLSIGQILKFPLSSRDVAVEQSLRSDGDEFFYHVTKRGETMEYIANIYLVSRGDLKIANPNLPRFLKTGQYIKIPVNAKRVKPLVEETLITADTIVPQKYPLATELEPNKTTAAEHIVKAGDNLYRIALEYKISVEEIKNVNPGLTQTLSIGQKIYIPAKKKENNFILHKVRRRIKVSQLARDFNVSLKDLRKLNPSIGKKIRSGTIIKIPLNLVLNQEVLEEIKTFSTVETKPPADTLVPTLNPDSIKCLNYINPNQEPYKIALMIPLFLEEIDSLKFTENINVDDLLDERPFRFLSFYYGVIMAVDSLNTLGANIKLSVFDVDNSIGKTINVLQDSSLQEQDLIIGPFYARSFKLASHFAKIFEIPIVNPLSNRSEVIDDNPFVFKSQPNVSSQNHQLRDLVATYFRDAKIFFVKHHQAAEEREFPLCFSEIQDLLDTGYYVLNDNIFDLIIEKSLVDTTTVKIEEFVDSLFVEDELLSAIYIEGTQILTDSIEFNLYDSTYIRNSVVTSYYSTDSIYGFEDNASIYRDNVVFVFTDDNVFALDLMTKLNILRDTFPTNLVGVPKWKQFSNMDNEILNNLKVHILSPAFVNYQNINTNHFIKDFRKRYLTEPLDYAFKGFDISWYFLNALMNFGKGFENCLPYFEPECIQSKMVFERVREGDGFENQFWKVLRYDRFRLRELEIHPPNPPESKDTAPI